MSHASIATFAAVLFLAAVYCSPARPQEAPTQELSNGPQPAADNLVPAPEGAARQKRLILQSPIVYPYSYYNPYEPYYTPFAYSHSPVYLFRKRRDVSNENINEQPAVEDVNPAEAEPTEEQKRSKRGYFYSTYHHYGYPTFYHSYHHYPRYYWFRK